MKLISQLPVYHIETHAAIWAAFITRRPEAVGEVTAQTCVSCNWGFLQQGHFLHVLSVLVLQDNMELLGH